MRPGYIFFLVAVSHRGNAGPRRRDLNWDMFGSDDLNMESGSTIPVTDDYSSNLAFFDVPPSSSSETGDFKTETSSDYPFTLDGTGTGTGTDISLGDWNFDSPTLENPDAASSTYLDPFGSDFISDSGCSADPTVSGKTRRDGGVCRNAGIAAPPKPKLPNPEEEKESPLEPGQPLKDPDWLRIYPKPLKPTPNDIRDPRFDHPEPQEPEEITPSTNIQGPCPWRTEYLCCETFGQLPLVMSSTPIQNCVKCM